MSLNSDRKLFPEELKRLNLPPDTPPVPTERHSTEEEWTELLEVLSALYRLTATQYDWLRSLNLSLPDSVRKELTQVAQDAIAIRRLLEQEQQRREQAGKKSGRRFSIRWPNISLPRLSLAWLFLPLTLVALLVLWWSWGALWSAISPILT